MYVATRRQHTRRRVKLIFSGLTISVVSTYLLAVLAWPLQPIMPTAITKTTVVPATAQPVWPTPYTALGTPDSGVLATSSDAQIPIASITKLITSLVVLESKPLTQGELGPVVPITATDVALYNQYIAMDGSVAPTIQGMQIHQLQLLQGMLLNSANNYADTTAVWAYGSTDQYLAAARKYLAAHGLTNTTVVDATGFSPGSKSTPSDLVKLGILAMKHPVIAGIVDQKSAVVPGVGTFTNTNKLLGTNGIVGLKTGTTDEAGSCLLFASEFIKDGKPITLIGVVLGAQNHPSLFQSVATLTQQTTNQFTTRTLVSSNQSFATYKTPWGAEVQATSEAISTLAWAGSSHSLTATPQAINPGDNAKAGTLTVATGSKKITKDLKLNAPLETPSPFWRITHPRYIFGL